MGDRRRQNDRTELIDRENGGRDSLKARIRKGSGVEIREKGVYRVLGHYL